MSKQSPGLPIPDDWNGTDWCRFAISWPDSLAWRAILAGFLTTPMLGRTWDRDTGTITEVQEIGREIFERNLDWRYSIVSTCSEISFSQLLTALNGIASAVRASSCCAPGNGTGYIEQEGVIYYGTEQPKDKPTTFGEGEEFPSEEAFSAHLCNAANNIVSGLILSLNNWSVLSLASLTVGGIVAAIFVANPPLAIFIALGVLAFAFAGFATMANYIDEHRQEWVCAIYLADNYADMLVRVDNLINDMVIDLEFGPFELHLTDLIHATLSTDVFNKAYTNIGLPAPIGSVECGECADVPFPDIELWGGDNGSNLTVTDLGEGLYGIEVTVDYNNGIYLVGGFIASGSTQTFNFQYAEYSSGATWVGQSGALGFTYIRPSTFNNKSIPGDFNDAGAAGAVFYNPIGSVTRIRLVVSLP